MNEFRNIRGKLLLQLLVGLYKLHFYSPFLPVTTGDIAVKGCAKLPQTFAAFLLSGRNLRLLLFLWLRRQIREGLLKEFI